MSDASTSRTGGQILVDNLVEQGCDRIFCVPGESYLAVLDALHDKDAIDLVVCRQEGGVSFMAAADGAMTGHPGIAFVTRGPGATNGSIGVHVAMQDSVPMIYFIGDVGRGDKDREAFQEIDFPAMFGPMCKWAAKIDQAERIPEYIARAYSVAMNGRPGPVVLALPEDMLRDTVEAADRPKVIRPAQHPDPEAMAVMMELLKDAVSPVAIVGGADWCAGASHYFQNFAEDIGIPVACGFRRQDAIPNESPVWAGNLGYGPNPKLLERIRAADLLLVVGARLGEATTDGYTLITPDHPDQTVIQVHPDPEELGSVYRTDLAICADMREFSEEASLWEHDIIDFDCGKDAHTEWEAWNSVTPNDDLALDLAQCVGTACEALPADSIICNGAGNFSGWWHRFWRYTGPVSQLAPTAGAMGYGVPAAVAASLRNPDRQVIAVAGDGDFLMNGQELATAVQHGCNMLVMVIDNGSYGTIRMHQERNYPERLSGTALSNPDFAALAKAYGCWSETIEKTADFAGALDRAKAETGVRLLHLKIDVEDQLAAGTSVAKVRAATSA
ncbi:thiamine pyrophosphate-binding protein [Parasphingopyxis sp. CP4]|uniref:thiamine pyrophosphate-binding protein n=1 Tax=Parasphingopyxis sp. CP4 TaxID=2724527 RepID=UPI0015A46DBD|nr:thiamine pyrophosphate-binding protein [Parasphingopyxis sp. CP4]QLC21964.1 thiamine pyrophosphate-binding protein [Parasphingopyxis sp. CP4]